MRKRGNPAFVRRQPDRSDQRVVCLVTPAERVRLKLAAKRRGVSVSQFVRAAALEVLDRGTP
jgi:uncharacterized protein (DUF1778 family)